MSFLNLLFMEAIVGIVAFWHILSSDFYSA